MVSNVTYFQSFFRTFCLLIIFILISPLAFTENPPLDSGIDAGLEQANNQDLDTYSAFLKHPTAENFEGVSVFYKQQYMESLTTFTGENAKIAKNYFTNAGNVNSNAKTFEKFMQTQGVSIKVDGTIAGFTNAYILQTKDAKIDLAEWKTEYGFHIRSDGKLELIPKKGMQIPHVVSGSITKVSVENKLFLEIDAGTIDGKPVKNAQVQFEGSSVKGVVSEFGNNIFEKNGKGMSGYITYDTSDNTLTIRNPTNELDMYFIQADTSMKIKSDSEATVYFAQKGNSFQMRNAQIEFTSDGSIGTFKALEKDGAVLTNGVIITAQKPNVPVYICKNVQCANNHKGSNVVSEIGNTLQAIGKDFQIILDRNTILEQRKEIIKATGIPQGKTWAEQFFIGSSVSDTHDYVGISLAIPDGFDAKNLPSWSEGGNVFLTKQNNNLQMSVTGQAFIDDGYWEVYSDGKRVGKGSAHNPFSIEEGNEVITSGRDAVPMTISFTMDDGTKKEGFTFIDRTGAPDLFQIPAQYLGLQHNSGSAQDYSELRENYVQQLHLLLGQPLDFKEGQKGETIACTNEFVCVDVVQSAYYLATGRDILADKSKLGFGTSTTRRNSELYQYFKTKTDWFDTQEFDGSDFLGSDEHLHGSWEKGVKVDPEKIIFPPKEGFNVDWEKTYGLEKDKVQFLMFEKQYVKEDIKKDKNGKPIIDLATDLPIPLGTYTKVEGSPLYHIVSVYYDEIKKEYMTVQAPGECKQEGVCKIPLNEYVNTNRCASLKELKDEGCYAYYGVKQVIKPKPVTH